MTMTVPRRHRGESGQGKHPATISPLTQSVSVAINGSGAVQQFNTTPTSPGCSAGPTGTTCTFTVYAPFGMDTFVVTTYSAPNRGGSTLDQGTAVELIQAAYSNSVSVVLGPVVSNTSDHSPGSLRSAIDNANPGDTIIFLIPSGS